MKVLVISRNAWKDTNAIGNTLSNFFKGMQDIEFANIYFRSSIPDNDLCKYYYRVTETEVFKKWFSPKKIGRKFFWSKQEKVEETSVAAKNENAIIRIIHKYNLNLAYKCSNYIWYSQRWINENLDEFVETFAPDIMVTFVKSAPQYYLTIKHLREKYNIPLFSWIADDEYTGLLKNHFLREIDNLRYILKESKIVKGCTEEICGYYNAVFGCNATPLYKGCDLSRNVKDTKTYPIKIVYAGNLLYGRYDVICRIAEILEVYSIRGKEVFLEIYSNTSLSSDEQTFFRHKKYTEYLGQQDYATISQCLADADIVLHVESFDADQVLKTKYSLSTKIMDCLQSGNVLLAVGSRELASINYVKKIPGTYVIENLENLDKQLCEVFDDIKAFGERAAMIRGFAQKHHDEAITLEEMRNIMNSMMREES